MSTSEIMEFLEMFYEPEELKGLSIDELNVLIDELAERYEVKSE